MPSQLACLTLALPAVARLRFRQVMHDLAVATMTWARTRDEEAVLERSLSALVAHGLPVIVADRSGSATFDTVLARLGVQIVRPASEGLVPQVQSAVAAAVARGSRRVLYTEPDKQFFFEHRLADFIACAPRDDDVGVVLAARTDDSFATYPPGQRYTESVANTLCAQLTGAAGDYFYGPFVIGGGLAGHVASLPAALGWGWRPAAFLAARRNGSRVVHWTADLPCPPDQRTEDHAERRHRLRQLSENVAGLCVEW